MPRFRLSMDRLFSAAWHPWLFATFPVLFMASVYPQFFYMRDVATPLLFALAFTWIAFRISSVLSLPYHKAALCISVSWIVLFSYYRAKLLLGSRLSVFSHDFVFVPVNIVLWLCAILLISRCTRNFTVLNRAANVFAVSIVMIPFCQVIRLFYREITANRDWGRHSEVIAPNRNSHAASEHGVRRNIYYIVLDEYPSSKALRTLWNYDNTRFERELEKLGFWVNPDSHSNYASTIDSLCSTLNMKYLDDGTRSRSYAWRRNAVEDNDVSRLLSREGYLYFRTRGMWPTNNPWSADLVYEGSRGAKGFSDNDFLFTILKGTLFQPFIGERSIMSNRERKRKHINESFEAIWRAHAEKATHFFFADLLIPHLPHSFKPDGRAQSGDVDKKTGFLDDVEYANSRLEEVLRALVKEEPVPIIIIQGDHGYRQISGFNLKDSEIDGGRIRLENLSALLLPGWGDRLVYKGMTPVNSFRIVMKHYFGYQYDLLPDLLFPTGDDEINYNVY